MTITVKQMIEYLSEFDDDDLVVTSSRACAWECYESVKKPKKDKMFPNGLAYEKEGISDEHKDPVVVVIV